MQGLSRLALGLVLSATPARGVGGVWPSSVFHSGPGGGLEVDTSDMRPSSLSEVSDNQGIYRPTSNFQGQAADYANGVIETDHGVKIPALFYFKNGHGPSGNFGWHMGELERAAPSAEEEVAVFVPVQTMSADMDADEAYEEDFDDLERRKTRKGKSSKLTLAPLLPAAVDNLARSGSRRKMSATQRALMESREDAEEFDEDGADFDEADDIEMLQLMEGQAAGNLPQLHFMPLSKLEQFTVHFLSPEDLATDGKRGGLSLERTVRLPAKKAPLGTSLERGSRPLNLRLKLPRGKSRVLRTVGDLEKFGDALALATPFFFFPTGLYLGAGAVFALTATAAATGAGLFPFMNPMLGMMALYAATAAKGATGTAPSAVATGAAVSSGMLPFPDFHPLAAGAAGAMGAGAGAGGAAGGQVNWQQMFWNYMWWMIWTRYWMNSMQIGQLFWWQWMNHYAPATATQISAQYKAWTDGMTKAMAQWPTYGYPFMPFGFPGGGATGASDTTAAETKTAAPATTKPATDGKTTEPKATDGKASTKLVADDSVVQLVKQQGGASERAANAVEEAMKRLGEKQPTNLAQVETHAA